MQHVHPDDYQSASSLQGQTTFPIWLSLPLPGRWHFHVSAMLPGGGAGGMGVSLELQQMFKAGNVSHSAPAPTSAGEPTSLPPERGVLTAIMPPITTRASQDDNWRVLPPATSESGTMRVAMRGSAIWQHACSRIALDFTDAATGEPVHDLVPWLHASTHTLIAAVPDAANAAAAPALRLWHAHGVPEPLDLALFGNGAPSRVDPCSAEVMHLPKADSEAERFGPTVVMHLRFAHAGRHELYVQVRPSMAHIQACAYPLSSSTRCGRKAALLPGGRRVVTQPFRGVIDLFVHRRHHADFAERGRAHCTHHRACAWHDRHTCARRGRRGVSELGGCGRGRHNGRPLDSRHPGRRCHATAIDARGHWPAVARHSAVRRRRWSGQRPAGGRCGGACAIGCAAQRCLLL